MKTFNTPTKDQVRALMASAIAQGVEVQVIPAGKRAEPQFKDPAIRHCQCGCDGDWTEHTMRLGEGRFADER